MKTLIAKVLKRIGFRRLSNGVEIGRLRLFWFRNLWRTKPHPYWFARNWNTIVTVQSGPFELFYRKEK